MSHRSLAAVAFAALAPILAVAGPVPSPLPWSIRSPSNTIASAEGVTGGFSFPNTAFEAGAWDAPVVVSTVASYSVATADAPDRVSSLPYEFALEVRDDVSGELARFSFAGELSGSYWRTGSALSNRFTGATTRSAELGGHTYTVELEGFTPPTGYGDSAAGVITARVILDPVAEPPVDSPVVGTPEPGSVALGAVAVLGGAAVARARRRR